MIIGLTGPVGSGKSLAARFLHEEYGAAMIELDALGRTVMEPSGRCHRQVVSLFGEGILLDNGSPDRKKIGEIVFAVPEMLARLNAVIHPAVREEALDLMEKIRAEDPEALIVMESAVLYGTGFDAYCDKVICITADKRIRRRRLMTERGYSRSRTDGVFRAQEKEEALMKKADVRLANNGTPEDLFRKIREVMTNWNSAV